MGWKGRGCYRIAYERYTTSNSCEQSIQCIQLFHASVLSIIIGTYFNEECTPSCSTHTSRHGIATIQQLQNVETYHSWRNSGNLVIDFGMLPWRLLSGKKMRITCMKKGQAMLMKRPTHGYEKANHACFKIMNRLGNQTEAFFVQVMPSQRQWDISFDIHLSAEIQSRLLCDLFCMMSQISQWISME